MYQDLTKGHIGKSLLLFALPMMAGNLLQQFYNIADTLIVGRVIGSNALAAVGSAYTLMTFLTSIFLGLSMGAGAYFSILKGKRETQKLHCAIWHAFMLNTIVTLVINLLVYIGLVPILHFLRIPSEVWDGMKTYLLIVLAGMIATSFYNFFACMLRALGNSRTPLIFLTVSTCLNIVLDVLFVAVWHFGIAGAAWATVVSQYVSGIGITCYVVIACRDVLPARQERTYDRNILNEIVNLSALTCLQQSVMNFGILLVQGLVNSFGAVVMAAFAAAVKIDTFAYLPVEDFGNAFSTFVAQNYGAGQKERIQKGCRKAFAMSAIFSCTISFLVCLFAPELMKIFIDPMEKEVIAAGVCYLRIEGVFYCGIGCLFLLYGYFRAIKRADISLLLTIISLGLRVVLAYLFAPLLGETGIWIAIPIGWCMADFTGLLCIRYNQKKEKIAKIAKNEKSC